MTRRHLHLVEEDKEPFCQVEIVFDRNLIPPGMNQYMVEAMARELRQATENYRNEIEAIRDEYIAKIPKLGGVPWQPKCLQ